MMIKTSELVGPALDWAVAKCEGALDEFEDRLTNCSSPCFYSTDWSQGGPIIEREVSDIVIVKEEGEGHVHVYINSSTLSEICCWGSTILIAAMRCYVTSKLGEGADIPAELCNG